jgi:hypothetical protein
VLCKKEKKKGKGLAGFEVKLGSSSSQADWAKSGPSPFSPSFHFSFNG